MTAANIAEWTRSHDGTLNASRHFQHLVAAVEEVIKANGADLVNGRVNNVGRLIVANLVHHHGLTPTVIHAHPTDGTICHKCQKFVDDAGLAR